MLKLHGHL